jgi:NhaC family Na+:H+ antiporter
MGWCSRHKKDKVPREVLQSKNLLEVAVFLILFTIGMLATVAIWHRPAYIVLLSGSVGVVCLGLRYGLSLRELGEMFVSGVLQAVPVVIIVSLIGMLTGVWKIGGVIPALMNLSFDLIRPQGFLLTAFLLTAMAAMLFGTATGTFSTIGIVLAGVGAVLAIPYPIVVGAIVSGAFVGDRSSPLSSTLNLVATMSGCDPRALIRYLWTTGALAVLLSAFFYFALDQVYSQETLNLAIVDDFRIIIRGNFQLSWWLFVPPLVMAVLAIARVPAQYNVLVILLCSTIVVMVVQGLGILDIGYAAIFGYPAAGDTEAARLLSGGGLLPIVPILATLCAATGFNGLLEGTGITRLVLSRFIKDVQEPTKLLKLTVAISAAVVTITSNQAVSIVIPARMLRYKLRDSGASELALARAIADSGGVLAAVVPWSTAALTPALLLGTKAHAFAPFAVFCWLQPMVQLAFLHHGSYARNISQTSETNT